MQATHEICLTQFAEVMKCSNKQRHILLAQLGAKFMKANLLAQEKEREVYPAKSA